MSISESPGTILIVDDEMTLPLEKMLEGEGFKVWSQKDGPSALTFLEHHAVDLVILDLMMEPMDGYAVLKEIRQRFGDDIAVLLASANTQPHAAAAVGLQVGADDYMEKPLDTLELRERISIKLRQRQVAQKLRSDQSEAKAQNALSQKVLHAMQSVAAQHMNAEFDSMVVRVLRQVFTDASATFWTVEGGRDLRPVPARTATLPTVVQESLMRDELFIRDGSQVYLPLRQDETVVGVMELGTQLTWPRDCETILETLADSLVILRQNNRYFRQLNRESELNALLNKLSTRDSALDEILSELLRFFNAPMFLFNRWLSLISGESLYGFIGESGEMSGPLATYYQNQKVVETLIARKQPIAIAARGSTPSHYVLPVMAGAELIGLLAVVLPAYYDDVMTLLDELERVARFLASVLQRHRELDVRERYRRAEFLREFLSLTDPESQSRPVLFMRASSFGLNLAQPGIVARITVPQIEASVDFSAPDFEQNVEELLGPYLRQSRRVRDQLQLGGVEVLMGDSVVAVIALPPTMTEDSAKVKLLQWANSVADLNTNLNGRAPRINIGIGRLAKEWKELPRSNQEAERALQWAASNRQSVCTYYGDLGSERLIAAIGDRQELHRFRNEQLGALMRYDDERNGDLVHTVEVFFANGAHLVQSAKELNIHANTLKYRLDQIAQLTSRDPRTPQTGLDFQLALKIHRML